MIRHLRFAILDFTVFLKSQEITETQNNAKLHQNASVMYEETLKKKTELCQS